MDMASTPALLEAVSPRTPVTDASDAVLMISADHAQDAEFVNAWEELAHVASEPNPFFEPWFIIPSLKAFADSTKIELFAHFTEGALTGLLPIGRTMDYYGYPIPHAAGWLHDNAFCGAPLVRRGYERGFWRSLLAHFDRNTKADLFLHLPKLSSEGSLSHALDTVLAEESRAFYTSLEESRALLASNLSAEEYYVASMSAKKRKELRRQQKRLSEHGNLEFSRTDSEEGLEQWIADFLSLEAAGWKGEAGSALAASDDTRNFFAEALKAAARAGKLERLTMTLDNCPIAMLANFVTVPGVYSFKTTFDEVFARFSPGMLLQLENLALIDREDIAWADSCASEGHSMIEPLWREKRTLKSRNIAIGGPIRRTIFKRLKAYETRNRSRA